MANNRKISEDTLVNWQSIFNGNYAQVLNGRLEETNGFAKQETTDEDDFDDDFDMDLVLTRPKSKN
ncbi:MAG: hypothetical protein AABW56_04220, partial [Nanoarchaeota archaeon]